MTALAALHYRPLTEVAALLRSRELSAIELTEAILGRIEAMNPALGAYYTVLAEEALAEAQWAESELAAGRCRGALHGVPIAFKDLYALGRTTAGSPLLADHVAGREAEVVRRARAAGAVVLGKLATHEFGLAAASLADHFPPARNPWNPELTPGGSSTGAGAAVAAGLSYGAYGTDTGGSVRLPAAHCGVVGFKPTFGAVSRAGIIPLSPSLDHAGPLARTVADAAALFAAVAGHDPEDAGSLSEPLEPGDLEPDVRGLRVGVPRDFWEPTCDPAVRERVDAALQVLSGLGAEVHEVELGLDVLAVMAVGYLVTLPEAAAYHLDVLRRRPGGYGHEFGLVLRAGLLQPAVAYVDAQNARSRIRGAVAAALREHDVLAMPTLGALPDPLPPGPRPLPKRISLSPTPQYTWLANAYGGPAVSVPCGLAGEGLPVGLQLAGLPRRDWTVLRAAHAYEQASGWRGLHPPAWP